MRPAVTAVAAVAIILVAACVARAADDVRERRLQARAVLVDPSSPIRIGDVVTVDVEVRGDGATTATLDVSLADATLESVGDPEVAAVLNDGPECAVHRLRIQPFAVGRLAIPPIRVVATAGGTTAEAETLAIPIVVEPLTGASAAPAAAKLTLPNAAPGALLPVIAAAVVASALGYRSYRRLVGRPVPGEIALAAGLIRLLRPRGEAATPAVDRPPRTLLDEIDALVAASDLSYDASRLHERLATLAVAWVEDSLAMRRRERTTAELVRVAGSRLGPERTARLGHVLGACDLVKFAREAPSREAFRTLAGELRRLVEGEDARRA